MLYLYLSLHMIVILCRQIVPLRLMLTGDSLVHFGTLVIFVKVTSHYYFTPKCIQFQVYFNVLNSCIFRLYLVLFWFSEALLTESLSVSTFRWPPHINIGWWPLMKRNPPAIEWKKKEEEDPETGNIEIDDTTTATANNNNEKRKRRNRKEPTDG